MHAGALAPTWVTAAAQPAAWPHTEHLFTPCLRRVMNPVWLVLRQSTCLDSETGLTLVPSRIESPQLALLPSRASASATS